MSKLLKNYVKLLPKSKFSVPKECVWNRKLKTCLHSKTQKTEKIMIRLKTHIYQKYKWECSSIKAVATWDWNVRKDKRHLVVYLDAWTVKKSLLHEQKLQKPLEIPIFQFASRLKIQADSLLTAFNVLENRMKSMAKTGVYTPFLFSKNSNN